MSFERGGSILGRRLDPGGTSVLDLVRFQGLRLTRFHASSVYQVGGADGLQGVYRFRVLDMGLRVLVCFGAILHGLLLEQIAAQADGTTATPSLEL